MNTRSRSQAGSVAERQPAVSGTAAGNGAVGVPPAADAMDVDANGNLGATNEQAGHFVEHQVPQQAQAAAGVIPAHVLAAAIEAVRQQLLGEFQPGTHGAEGKNAAQAPPAVSPRFSPVSSPRAGPEPRVTDLAEYEGASGAKLDDWLANLNRLAEYYELTDQKTVKFGVVRLRGAADSWWRQLSADTRAEVKDGAALAAKLRERFQPVTAERTARAELHRLEQGGRGVDAYIADFQRLCALVPSANAEEKCFLFERGLRRDISEKLRIAGVTTLDAAINMAARVGNLADAVHGRAGSSSSGPPARLHQMEESADVSMVDVRINRLEATLNAMQQRSQGGDGASGGFMGLGAKTQTRRGYQQQAEASGRGGRGRSSSRPARPLPMVPGVSADVVQQRLANRTCLRCGEEGHTSHGCPNSIKSSN